VANTVVSGASVEITLDLTKFATDAWTNVTKALSSPQMRDAITECLDAASRGGDGIRGARDDGA
jgi:hypothetical protein